MEIQGEGSDAWIQNSIVETHEGQGVAVKCGSGEISLSRFHLLFGGDQVLLAGDYAPEDVGVVSVEAVNACTLGCCSTMEGNVLGSLCSRVKEGMTQNPGLPFEPRKSGNRNRRLEAFLPTGIAAVSNGLVDLDGEVHPGADGVWDIGIDAVD